MVLAWFWFLSEGSREFALLSLKHGIIWNFLVKQDAAFWGILLGRLLKIHIKHPNKLICREALIE